MKLFKLLLLILILASCNTKTEQTTQKTDTIAKVDTVSPTNYNVPPFRNPALIYGSAFCNFFQALYKVERYDDMVKFTHYDPKYISYTELMNFYSNVQFGYKINKLTALSTKDSIHYTLSYEREKFGTKVIIRMPVIIVNDSTKFDLTDLKNNFLTK